MAEGVFASLHKGVFVSSAGLMTENGLHANDNAIYAAGQMKIDISSHRSRQVTPDMIMDADYVFCMSKGHKEALYTFPNV